MAIYISPIVHAYKVIDRNNGYVFFLGGSEPHEASEFVALHGLDRFAGARGKKPKLYYELPRWLYGTVERLGVEQVKMSEFDWRTCGAGQGIPTVQYGLVFSEESES